MKTTWTDVISKCGMAVVIGLISLGTAQADLGGDAQAGHISLGPRAMYFIPKDADEGDLHGGAQLRFHFSDAIAVEGSVDYRQEEFGPADVDIFPVQASLLAYLLPGSRISPYILGGAGWYFTRVKAFGQKDTDHRFGPHVGAGLQVFLNHYWSIDASYRYVWVEKFTSRDETNVFDKDYNDSGSMITAALNFHF